MNLIKCIVAVVAIGLWCAGMVWNMIKERELRRERDDLARYKKARGMLKLEDKPYMMPKQSPLSEVRGKWPGDESIDDILEALNQQQSPIIQGPKEPDAVPLCDYRCRS